jgi:L-methionine (R)-S-oxide reductase
LQWAKEYAGPLRQNKTQLVADVHQFPGHIACDGGSNSEIVVPMLLDGKVIGVIDLDSYSFDRFDEREQQALEKIAQLLVQQCDWNSLDAQ